MTSWIEGVGDEVTVGLVVALLLGVLLVAWLSTGIYGIIFMTFIFPSIILTASYFVQTVYKYLRSLQNVRQISRSV